MINIVEKKDCCGCRACTVKCPKSCISMKTDTEGFDYPKVDKELCIDCGLCEKVCPVINQSDIIKPTEVYASINENIDIRLSSSSGGIFTPLAESVIASGGVVFGVSWSKEWLVEHTYTESKEGLAKFRGSKYLQSNTNNSYLQTEKFLKDGKKVLFTGTPCQISGLRKFLIKEYENLLCAEVICHGTPSPMIWSDYLNYICIKKDIQKNKIDNIIFRDKCLGWNLYSVSIKYNNNINTFSEPFNKNIYMLGFLKNLTLRPSCYECPARSGKSGADIALADYWGVSKHHNIDDDKGVGLVLIYSQKGKKIYDRLDLKNTPSNYDYAIKGNPCIEHSVKEPKERALFWTNYPKQGIATIENICKKMRPSFFQKLSRKGYSILKKISNR